MLNALSSRWAFPPQSRTVSSKKPSASMRTRSVRWSVVRGPDGDALPAPLLILASEEIAILPRLGDHFSRPAASWFRLDRCRLRLLWSMLQPAEPQDKRLGRNCPE